HISRSSRSSALASRSLRKSAELSDGHGLCYAMRRPSCTKFGHPLVKPLHSIQLKGHIRACFSLTPQIKGVKETRSLTCSEVFPVGAASGAQARSQSNIAR